MQDELNSRYLEMKKLQNYWGN